MLELGALGGARGAGERLEPGVDLERIGRDRHRLLAAAPAAAAASAIATAVLPTPVGPNSAITSERGTGRQYRAAMDAGARS